jgi:hypothetical protein
MSDALRESFNQAICDELAAALGRIAHCVSQLRQEQIWWRSRPDMNSIGNLLLHLAGNIRQLIVTGVGGATDVRDRAAEFTERGPISSDELLERLFATVKQAQVAIHAASPEQLCGLIPVKRYEWTGLQAIIRSVSHFRGHTQEIIHMTRELLGEEYEFAGQR